VLFEEMFCGLEAPEKGILRSVTQELISAKVRKWGAVKSGAR